MAELWDLPVIFVIENNQYAMGTSRQARHQEPRLLGARRRLRDPGRDRRRDGRAGGQGRGREGGRRTARAGKGPYILEVMTYRYRGHSMSDPAKYRTREEVQKMREERDPIEQVRKRLLDAGTRPRTSSRPSTRRSRTWSTRPPNSPAKAPSPTSSELWTDIYATEVPQGVEA